MHFTQVTLHLPMASMKPYLQFDLYSYNIVMIQEVSEYFNRFYQTVLRQHINDAIIHSQWTYFLSMFKNASLQKERIQLYLGILTSEKSKKSEQKIKEQKITSYSNTESFKIRHESKIKLNSSQENHYDIPEVKLEKRYSESWKLNISNQSIKGGKDSKATQESISVKKKVSVEEDINKYCLRSMQDVKPKNEAFTTTFSPNSYAYIRPKSSIEVATELRQTKAKQRHLKLCEISSKLVSVFEGPKLRA